MISNNTNQSVRILVDADSCPVLDEITRIGDQYKIKVVLVASVSHFSDGHSSTERVYVDNLPQAVDMELVNRTTTSDVIVTGDYGLASLILAKGAKVISPRGYIYSERNMDRLLAERHIGAQIRKGGGRTKGPKQMTKLDKEKFTRNLVKLIMG